LTIGAAIHRIATFLRYPGDAPLANFTTPLDTKDDGLERVGGKGRSLAKLTNAGFQVPGGFQVTTTAYRGYVKDNGLQERILKLAQPAVVSGRASFQQASEDVQGLFDNTLSPELIKEITAAYQALKGQPAAGSVVCRATGDVS
jgi:rifampicin phosphotransferase